MRRKTLRDAVLAGLLLVGAFLPAQAALMTWSLDGVTFNDGTTATGSIVMDPTAHTSSAFSVSTTAGSLSAFTFDNSNSGLYFGGGAGPNNFILFDTHTPQRYFNFSFVSALNSAGGTFALNTASSYECMNCFPSRRVTAGSLTTAAADVPEPGTVAMLVPALGMLGWMSRRRRKQPAQ